MNGSDKDDAKGYSRHVRLLIGVGADVNMSDNMGYTALMRNELLLKQL